MSERTLPNQFKTMNDAADFWRNDIGVNVIGANTRKKETYESWKEWQDKPIPQELHDKWKSSGAFNNGMAIILGITIVLFLGLIGSCNNNSNHIRN